MRLLHLIPEFDHDSPHRALCLLTRHLPAGEFEQAVAVLREPRSDSAPFAGSEVVSLGGRRRHDPLPLLELRRLCRRWQPDVIHVWQPTALRALRLAGIASAPVVCSAAVAPAPGVFDRWLLRGVERVVVHTTGDARRCERLGIGVEQIRQLPAAVEIPAIMERSKRELRTIVCQGHMERTAGFLAAPWAFDILRFLRTDLELLLVGDGPYRRHLEHFVGNLQHEGRIRFLGSRADSLAILAGADIVWVLDRYERSIQTGLEALAAGRPVITSAPSAFAEVVEPGQAMLSCGAGEPSELARQTRFLLDDAGLAAQLGTAGRGQARRFPPEELVRQAALMYQELLGQRRSPTATKLELAHAGG